MKNYYKIQEISKLYGICADTIPYYEEQGLIHPKRSAGNYRLFSIRDIGNLNIIRNLRELGLPIGQIRQYVHTRSVSSTLDLYQREQAMIQEKILLLERQYQDLERSRSDLFSALSLPLWTPEFLEFEKRPCFRLAGDAVPGYDVDFLLKKLEHDHEDVIKIIGSTDIGASYDLENALAGNFEPVRSVFFMGTPQYKDAVIPAGTYASITYKGDYSQLKEAFCSLMDFIEKNHHQAAGNPFEIYHVDMRETNVREEYITQLQLLVRPF